MTWEEKLAAVNALERCGLHMRRPGEWYADGPDMSKPNYGFLRGSVGNGGSPEEAVNDLWSAVTEPGWYVVLHPMDPNRRREVSWNGHMWKDVLK